MSDPTKLSAVDIDARIDVRHNQDGSFKQEVATGNDLLLAASSGDGSAWLLSDRLVGRPTIQNPSSAVLKVTAGAVTFPGGEGRRTTTQTVTNPGPAGDYEIWAVKTGDTWSAAAYSSPPVGADKFEVATAHWDGAAWSAVVSLSEPTSAHERLSDVLTIIAVGGTQYKRVTALQFSGSMQVTTFTGGVLTIGVPLTGPGTTGDMVGNTLTDSTGPLRLTASAGNDIILKLSDAAGARKVLFKDSGDVTVASLNSDGLLDLATTPTVNSTALVLTDDGRLSDARAPLAHNQLLATITDHASLTTGPHVTSAEHTIIAGAAQVGSANAWTVAQNLPTGSQVNSSNIVTANDARLSDARTPLAHNQLLATITDHADLTAGPHVTSAEHTLISGAAQKGVYNVWGWAQNFLAGSQVDGETIIVNSDTRLSNARSPTAHVHSADAGQGGALAGYFSTVAVAGSTSQVSANSVLEFAVSSGTSVLVLDTNAGNVRLTIPAGALQLAGTGVAATAARSDHTHTRYAEAEDYQPITNCAVGTVISSNQGAVGYSTVPRLRFTATSAAGANGQIFLAFPSMFPAGGSFTLRLFLSTEQAVTTGQGTLGFYASARGADAYLPSGGVPPDAATWTVARAIYSSTYSEFKVLEFAFGADSAWQAGRLLNVQIALTTTLANLNLHLHRAEIAYTA